MTNYHRREALKPAILLSVAALMAGAACQGDSPSAEDASDAGGTAGTLSVVSIADVQGPDDSSPLRDARVRTEGVVSGDFQDGDDDQRSNLGGFFLQSLADDGNPATSEGVFVFEPRGMTIDVDVGDWVAVLGRVQEHFGETQIVASDVTRLGSRDIRIKDIQLPAAGVTMNSDGDPVADFEAYEGMLVRFGQVLTINEAYQLERFGELRLSQGGRVYQFTNRAAPDAKEYAAHRVAVAERSVTLDDGLRDAGARPVRYLWHGEATDSATRVGDTVSGLVGNLRYSRGSGGSGDETWRVMPTTDPAFAAANPRPGKPIVGGSLKVASFNLLNYFSSVDTGRSICGPLEDQSCRGADSPNELRRQRQKIVTALSMIDADILGLVELENNDARSLSDIVDALNAAAGDDEFDFVRTGTLGADTIKTGFIFKPAAVALAGKFAVLDATIDPRFDDRRNRPALAQTFRTAGSGALITVAVIHLKSKGSDCIDDGDPNLADGQGNCSATRSRAAAALADWLARDPTGSGADDSLIIGDLNAYLEEDPLTALENAGYVNTLKAANGADPYSFVYDGQSGALDHAFASAGLAPRIVATVEWHINADEAPIHDYNLDGGRDSRIFDGETPYRSSDHDPVIVGLDLE